MDRRGVAAAGVLALVMFALAGVRVNLLRGTIDVVEAMTETNGHLATAPTKTGARRTVSLPRFLAEMMAAHIVKPPPRAPALPKVSPPKEFRGQLKLSNSCDANATATGVAPSV
jgi:hypothetical protein